MEYYATKKNLPAEKSYCCEKNKQDPERSDPIRGGGMHEAPTWGTNLHTPAFLHTVLEAPGQGLFSGILICRI